MKFLKQSAFVFLCLMHCFTFPVEAMIKTVAFDFGGVVVASYRAQLAQYLMSTLQLNRDEVCCAFSEMIIQQEKGIAEEDYWQGFANKKSIQLPPDWFHQYKQMESQAIRLIPETIFLIEELQKQGYRTALLSNMSDYQAKVMRDLGYFRWFDPLLLSYQTGYSKPDPKAFENLLKVLNEMPDEVVFIDDKEENVKAARKMGIHGIHYKNFEQLEVDLQKWGIKINKGAAHVDP